MIEESRKLELGKPKILRYWTERKRPKDRCRKLNDLLLWVNFSILLLTVLAPL